MSYLDPRHGHTPLHVKNMRAKEISICADPAMPEAQVTAYNPRTRTGTAVGTVEKVDTMGHRIDVDSTDVKDMTSVLYRHNAEEFPIGKVLHVQKGESKDGERQINVTFQLGNSEEGGTPLIDHAHYALKEGHLKGVSIGYMADYRNIPQISEIGEDKEE